MRTKVSPSTALRTWPMWAALLGLMFVCSTMIFSPAAACGWRGSGQQGGPVGGAVEPNVQVAVAGHFEGGHALDAGESGGQFLCDLSGGLAKLLGELERDRQGKLPERALLRLLEQDWNVHSILFSDVLGHLPLDLLL